MSSKVIKVNNFPISQLHKSGAGFTLIEVILSVFVFAMLSGGVIALVSGIITSSNSQGVLSANADQARRLTFNLMQELRNAVTSSTGAYALDTASAQQIIFYANVDGGVDIENPLSEIIKIIEG